MSRNLTFDRSWDVAICLDSADAGAKIFPCKENTGEAMRGFLSWLSTNTRFHNKPLRAKRKQLATLADAIVGASWKSHGKQFERFDFIPYGIGSDRTDNLGETFHKMLVISPFVSKSVIEGFAEKRLTNPDCTLITRKDELPKLDKNLLTAFDTYIIKDDVVFGEERLSESGENMTQDIHAKLYLRTKWSNSELYIGSANASYSAFHGGNVECLIALYGKQRYLNVDKLKTDLGLDNLDDKSCPFERIEPKDNAAQPEDAVTQKLEFAVKKFCAARKTAAVSGENPYTITVSIKSPVSEVVLTISPLMKNNPQKISERLVFTGLAIRELSEWYKVTAKKGGQELRRVIKIQTTGIPESRDSAVFSDIIRDKNAFLTYIAFLLSDDYLAAFLESLKKGSGDFRFLNMSYDAPMCDALKAITASYIIDTYSSFVNSDRKSQIRMRSHYAVGFYQQQGDEKTSQRKENLRTAFNAPFRPFVLATTSIGQEGLDFHNYARKIMHWNLPHNPIDIEQREGRINRFKCLAIRQSLAAKYRSREFDKDVWNELFDKYALADKHDNDPELVPYWCLPDGGDVKIERIVPMYPYSRDKAIYDRLLKILSLYRVTLGQARQEELLEYLFTKEYNEETLKELFINLSPFSKGFSMKVDEDKKPEEST